jgi:uncharacterized RDD family membrane protein YckC
MEETSNPANGCSRCGKPLPEDAPQGLCAACLLLAGTETLSQSMGSAPTAWGGDAPSTDDALRLIAGQSWGPYRIGRLLGRGGMGEVYEAEHTRTGRRLALKVLRSRLQNADERARFLREGQLAASVSHPHTVYIFGSEEISGTPVISMELAPGGTLKDRVASKGPLPPAEAVSAVLDIIGGLDAAQSSGILHRDIKPSNCFLDDDGVVKVGDFGLSISTLARDVHRDVSTGSFQGTPQFAAPEQLRGEPLDVRADIYAVGATLYYLLTGQPPFEARDMRDLVAQVTTELPKSPRLLRPEIPPGLASVVLACLDKTPSQRPASYAALADALRPFSATGHVPAPLGLRFLAGIIDGVILQFGTAILPLSLGYALISMQVAETMLWTGIPLLAYFLLEGFWGATPGKRLLGMRVRSVDGGAASWGRIAFRHALFDLPTWLLWVTFIPIVGTARFNEFVVTHPNLVAAFSLGSLVVVAAYFLTARRHNGWAALHDLASGTRLVLLRGSEQRRAHVTAPTAPLSGEQSPTAGLHYGPFDVASDSGTSDNGRLIIGFDPALRRRVWIRTLPPDTPLISTARRDASRTGRLHWLTGRRSAEENWDAFEAPDGQPFLAHRTPTSWPTMKLWLLDLANELRASIHEGSLPKLGLDRIWIRNDGHLVLLDFPADAASHDSQELAPVRLLSAVADHGLSRDMNATGPTPLTARSVIDQWSGPNPPELEEARASLIGLSSALDSVPKWRRAIPIALAVIPFVVMAASALVVMPPVLRVMTPERTEMINLLESLSNQSAPVEPRLADPEYRAALERYLAGRHGALLRDDALWNDPMFVALNSPSLRGIARDIATRRPSVSAEEVSRAETLIASQLEKAKPLREPEALAGLVGAISAVTALVVIVWSLISSAIIPGGVAMRILGLAIVTRDSKEIGRLRSVVRVAIAWLPAIVWLAWVLANFNAPGHVPLGTTSWLGIGLAFIPTMIGAAWAIAHPTRGLHDRLVDTWIVPR